MGVAEPRRVVRVTATTVLVSKFEEGFAAHLHESIAATPLLFDDAEVLRRYRDLASTSPETPRVECWRSAVADLVASSAAERLTADDRAELLAGTDSVAALLDSILWLTPTASAAFTAGPAETAALEDALARMDADSSLFTRYYGTFEGRAVVNHCPGALYARRLLVQAWSICTGPARS